MPKGPTKQGKSIRGVFRTVSTFSKRPCSCGQANGCSAAKDGDFFDFRKNQHIEILCSGHVYGYARAGEKLCPSLIRKKEAIEILLLTVQFVVLIVSVQGIRGIFQDPSTEEFIEGQGITTAWEPEYYAENVVPPDFRCHAYHPCNCHASDDFFS